LFFYAAVYAPNGTINISGQADLYGSYVGHSTTITGQGEVHFDEALQNITGNNGVYLVSVWKE